MTPRLTSAVALVIEHLRLGCDGYGAVYEAAEFWDLTRGEIGDAFIKVHGVSPDNWKDPDDGR